MFGRSAAKRVAQLRQRVGIAAWQMSWPARRESGERGPASSRRVRSSQAWRGRWPRAPSLRQPSSTGSGTSNGWYGQPSPSRAAAISSAPSGAPCAFSVPCRFGAPKPMTVRQAISDGRSLSRAASIAAAIACRVVAVDPARRPAASLEARKLVVRGRTARSRRRWRCRCRRTARSAGRARDGRRATIASWLMPSIRQPSPAIT